MPQPLNRIVLALALVLAVTGAASADQVSDTITRQLRQQGYTEITVTRTFLGRERILATSPTREREIIVNPRTREILRDYTESRDGASDDGARRGLLDLFGTSDNAGAGASGGGDSGGDTGDGDSGDGDSGDSGDGDSGDGDSGDGDGDGEGGDD